MRLFFSHYKFGVESVYWIFSGFLLLSKTLPIIKPIVLALKPKMTEGTKVSKLLARSHTTIPEKTESMAPVSLLDLKKRPAVSGTKSDTRLMADASPTNSYMSLRINAITKEIKVIKTTLTRFHASSFFLKNRLK